jgi:A/G-specific adenine glycosylase
MEMNTKYAEFTKFLMLWHRKSNARELPWKSIYDPYKIWLSEILLQQTKAEQVIPYFNAFVKSFPTITALAKAPVDKIYKLWQGLGYYNRCNNLIHTAKHIHENLNGVFPNTFSEIIALKGIGPYTASAIASFAFNLPYAVVDGNVYRILSRYFGIEKGIFTAADKRFYANLAQILLGDKPSAKYNQAIMDFGASICKPALPLCNICPINSNCIALKENRLSKLPIKKPVIKIRDRHFHYLVIIENDLCYINKRSAKDIWQNLHEFYLIESDSKYIQLDNSILKILPNPLQYFQKLTHQHIYSYYYILEKWPKKLTNKKDFMAIPIKSLSNYAMPKSIIQFRDDFFK